MRQAEVAAHLDLAVRNLRDLYAKGIIDKSANLDTQRVQYIRRLRETAAGRAAPEGALDPAQERARRDRESALLTEQRRLKEAGELVPVGDVIEEWGNQISIAKGRLLALPSRLAPDLARCTETRQAERIIRAALITILEELAGDDAQ